MSISDVIFKRIESGRKNDVSKPLSSPHSHPWPEGTNYLGSRMSVVLESLYREFDGCPAAALVRAIDAAACNDDRGEVLRLASEYGPAILEALGEPWLRGAALSQAARATFIRSEAFD